MRACARAYGLSAEGEDDEQKPGPPAAFREQPPGLRVFVAQLLLGCAGSAVLVLAALGVASAELDFYFLFGNCRNPEVWSWGS